MSQTRRSSADESFPRRSSLPKTLPHPRPADENKERVYLYADKHDLAKAAGVHPPAEDNVGAVPHHDDIHSTDTLLPTQQRKGMGISLNYLGMAALFTVIVWIVLKDRLGSNTKLVAGRGLPAHTRGGLRWE
jgi:hypothetical protein